MHARTGIKIRSIQNYKSGTAEPKATAIALLAKGTGTSAAWLLGLPEVDEPVPPTVDVERFESDGGYVMVPQYDVRASAGHGAVVGGEDVVRHLAFREEWVRGVLGVAPGRLAALTAVGDSMQPTICTGDTLLIERDVEQVVEGAVYVLEVEGTLMTKRLQRLSDGTLVMRSDNTDYEPDRIARDRAGAVRIIGRVRWIARLV